MTLALKEALQRLGLWTDQWAALNDMLTTQFYVQPLPLKNRLSLPFGPGSGTGRFSCKQYTFQKKTKPLQCVPVPGRMRKVIIGNAGFHTSLRSPLECRTADRFSWAMTEAKRGQNKDAERGSSGQCLRACQTLSKHTLHDPHVRIVSRGGAATTTEQLIGQLGAEESICEGWGRVDYLNRNTLRKLLPHLFI